MQRLQNNISEEMYKLLILGVDAVEDYAIYILNPQGIVLTWNRGAQKLKGYTADEVIGQHFSKFYTEEAQRNLHPEFELEVAKVKGRYEEEGWRVRKDGSEFWAYVIITTLYDEQGEVIGFTKVTKDLTEKKKMEVHLRQEKDRAEALHKELEAFVYSVAHDLRSPLRSIDGFCKLLINGKGQEKLTPDEQRYLANIRENSQYMGALIDDLLNLSRLTRTEMRLLPVNLSNIANEILAGYQEKEPERHVNVKIMNNLIVKGDPILLRICLDNLLSNAWKFTSQKESTEIELGITKQDGMTAYFIRDNGAGFNMKYAGKLFGIFQRLHRIDEFPGTGIGLISAQRIIQRHGGSIWGEGEEGRGATFYFTLSG